MQTKVNRQLYFDMQEHPERYTDEQVEAMMDELDREPDTEQAWQEWVESEKLKVKVKNAVRIASLHASLFTLHTLIAAGCR